jgi:hypothetical protein
MMPLSNEFRITVSSQSAELSPLVDPLPEFIYSTTAGAEIADSKSKLYSYGLQRSDIA